MDVNYHVADRDLKYYIFDWDDNVLHMPTHIHLERRLPDGETWVPHAVSTSLYSIIRNDTVNYRPPEGDWEKAFREFRDFASDAESKFLQDAKVAIARLLDGTSKAPPSFSTFKKALVEGRLFAIVTARGHRSDTLRKGVELFIARVLTDAERAAMLRNLRGYIACYLGEEALQRYASDADVLDYYLSLNKYHAVTSPQFRKIIEGKVPDANQSEARKQFAIMDFIEHLFGIIEQNGMHKPISIGFSDDDRANLDSVTAFIRERLGARFPSVRFVVYDTSDPALEKGRKVVVSGQMRLEI